MFLLPPELVAFVWGIALGVVGTIAVYAFATL